LINDFVMVKHKLPWDFPYIHLYPIADAHIGSAEFDEKLFKLWVQTVQGDPYGYAVIAGDMLNNGIKTSKTNVYEEQMRPAQQKEYLHESLKPIKEKILGACGGNHCYRNICEVDDDPLYDVFCRLGIEDRYRQNACFLKISLGRAKKDRQVSYCVVLVHGKSRNKLIKWEYSVDGADVIISGHTHTPEETPPCKIRVDMHNEAVSTTEFTSVVCSSFQDYGGYALRGLMLPNASKRFQILTLDGTAKHVGYENK